MNRRGPRQDFLSSHIVHGAVVLAISATAKANYDGPAMPSDARQLGREGTMDAVRRLLAARFHVAPTAEAIPADAPLFSIGVGLSSMEGMELLVELEKEFGVRIKDVDWWVYETPTLATLADFLIELTDERPPA